MNVPNPRGEPRSRRTFSEPPKRRGLKDVDAAERVTRLRAAVFGVYGGALGWALALFFAERGAPFWVVVLCPLAGWLFVSLGTLLITGSAGSAASVLYAPSSGAPPRKKEYSQAESLVASGRYEEAVSAFELAVAEDPSDPTPYLRIARIHRDHLGRAEDSVRWFRRALRESEVARGTAILARKELIELFSHRMGAPERALPELARMAEELAGSPEGEWAASELREIKARLSEGETR
jgi:tetratricopeptide (TPR) repeat protein